MGKEKDKKPLFGGIFQKFFKPSAKAEAKKKKEHHLTVQRSIPYLEMGRDGICRVEEHLYSKTVRFYDINYQLAQNEDKNTIFESWCDFLNYFDSSIRFQLSFINHKSDMSEYNKVIQIEPQHDQFDDVRIAVRRSWDVWSGIPVHLQVFWQMSAIVVMYWQERPLHRTF